MASKSFSLIYDKLKALILGIKTFAITVTMTGVDIFRDKIIDGLTICENLMKTFKVDIKVTHSNFDQRDQSNLSLSQPVPDKIKFKLAVTGIQVNEAVKELNEYAQAYSYQQLVANDSSHSNSLVLNEQILQIQSEFNVLIKKYMDTYYILGIKERITEACERLSKLVEKSQPRVPRMTFKDDYSSEILKMTEFFKRKEALLQGIQKAQ